jgi:hypothetical protein
MTKQFLLAAAPPPRGGGILLQLSSKQLAKPTAFGALTAATETAIDDNRTAALSPRQSPLRPCPVPRVAAITCWRTRIAGRGIARGREPGKCRRIPSIAELWLALQAARFAQDCR